MKIVTSPKGADLFQSEQMIGEVVNACLQLSPIGEENEGARVRVREVDSKGATSKCKILSVTGTDGVTKQLFVKRYQSSREGQEFWERQLRQDYQVACSLAGLLEKSDWFRVPWPYFRIQGHSTLVSEYINGENLSRHYLRRLRFFGVENYHRVSLSDLAHKIGKGLVNLQAIPEGALDRGVVCAPSSEIASSYLRLLEEASAFFGKRGLCPRLVSEAQSVLTEILTGYFQYRPRYCLQHTDFVLQNFIMAEDGSLYLVDFPNATIGVPFWDIAHFVGSLEDLTYLRTTSRRAVAKIIETFLSVFEEQPWFSSKMLSGFMLLIQLQSTMIILSEGGLKWKFLAPFLLEDPVRRFQRRVEDLLASIGRHH